MQPMSGVLPQIDDPSVDAVVARIDATVAAAVTDHDRLEEAWRDTFSLPYWYFLAQRDEHGQDSLYVGTVQGRPHLAGFTTARRLREFAVDVLGVVTGDQEAPAAVLTPRGFIGVAEQYAQVGVEGIAFDHGYTGHYTPMTNLKPLWEHCFGVSFDSGYVPPFTS